MCTYRVFTSYVVTLFVDHVWLGAAAADAARARAVVVAVALSSGVLVLSLLDSCTERWLVDCMKVCTYVHKYNNNYIYTHIYVC